MDTSSTSHLTTAKITWNKQFPDYSMENLRTHNVVEQENCFLVEIKHPVCVFLENNERFLGNIDINTVLTSIDDDDRVFYKLSKQVFDVVCQVFEHRLLPQMEQKYYADRIQSVKECLANCTEMHEKNPEQLVEKIKTILWLNN